jgi:hypothetical protein
MKIELRSQTAALVVAAMLVALAGEANAVYYSMSGSITMKYATTLRRTIGPRSGVALGTGVGPVNFPIPASLFKNSVMTFQVFPGYPSVAQVVATSTTTHPAPAPLAKGAGPGNLAWCPGPGNPKNPVCTNPAQATGGLNGLIVYSKGANQFGGAIKLLTKTKGETSRRIATNPLQFNHVARTSNGAWLAGGPYESTIVVNRPPGVITQSPVLGPQGSIQTPGIYIGMGPPPPSIIQTGIPLTTGMIVGRDSRPAPFTQTLTGYDNRTANGVGTIQLVGGAFFNQPAAAPAQAFLGNSTIKLTLPEPTIAIGIVLGSLAVLGLASRHRERSSE